MKNILVLSLITLGMGSVVGEQQSLAVTIYNDDFAMVKDVRSIDFEAGTSALYFDDVSANIQPETVTFKALSDPESIRVFEQNFERNLVDSNSILKKYINQEITVYAELADMVRKVRGTLLGYSSGYILKTTFGVNVYNRIAGVEFPPYQMVSSPLPLSTGGSGARRPPAPTVKWPTALLASDGRLTTP